MYTLYTHTVQRPPTYMCVCMYSIQHVRTYTSAVCMYVGYCNNVLYVRDSCMYVYVRMYIIFYYLYV